MTQWDERVNAHPTKGLVGEILGRLGSLETPSDVSDVERLDRLRAVVELVRWIIENTDAALVSPRMLSSLQEPLGYLQGAIDAYAEDSTITALGDCDSYADQILDAVSGWPAPTGPIDPESYRKGLESFRKSAGQFLRGVEEEVKALAAEHKTSGDELRNQLEQVREQVKAVTTQLEAERANLRTLSAQYQQQFSEAQETRQTEFAESMEKQKDSFAEELSQAVEQGEATLEALQQQGNTILESMKKANEKAERLLEAIGKTGTTFKYRDWGNEQRGQANFWRWVAAGSLLVIVAIGLWFLWDSGESSLEASAAIGKLFISLPLGVLAAYAARQSHQHRELEQAARDLELDLAALDPFIALLDEAEQHRIKAEMARRLFGHRYRPGQSEAAPLPPNLVDELARVLKPILGRDEKTE